MLNGWQSLKLRRGVANSYRKRESSNRGTLLEEASIVVRFPIKERGCLDCIGRRRRKEKKMWEKTEAGPLQIMGFLITPLEKNVCWNRLAKRKGFGESEHYREKGPEKKRSLVLKTLRKEGGWKLKFETAEFLQTEKGSTSRGSFRRLAVTPWVSIKRAGKGEKERVTQKGENKAATHFTCTATSRDERHLDGMSDGGLSQEKKSS